MFFSFSGKTANDVWSQAATMLLEKTDPQIESRSGDTLEILHSLIHIETPTQRWVTRRTPPMSIGFALAELIWILAGSDEAGVINFWNPSLSKFSGSEDNYHGAYGHRIRNNFGFDQLERAYLTLKNNPKSRQSVILIWDPLKDAPDEAGHAVSDDIPCNICSLLKMRDNKLEWTQIMRSNDVFLGLPYNLIQFTSMQEILAGWLGVDVGSYCHYSDSLHLYCRDLSKVSVLEEDEKLANEDSLLISKLDSSKAIESIYRRMEIISSNNVTEADLSELSELDTIHTAYRNIMYIIALYSADKKGYNSLAQTLQTRCSNNLYISLWKRWKESKNNVG